MVGQYVEKEAFRRSDSFYSFYRIVQFLRRFFRVKSGVAIRIDRHRRRSSVNCDGSQCLLYWQLKVKTLNE